MDVIVILMQKRLMRSQFFFSMSNSFRNMTIIKLVKLFQKPLQAFQFPVKNENRGTVDMRIPVLRNYLQELRMISPHVPANWPCNNLNRSGGVVRKSARCAKMNMSLMRHREPKRISHDSIKFAPNMSI
jgi:hypothetical protein